MFVAAIGTAAKSRNHTQKILLGHWEMKEMKELFLYRTMYMGTRKLFQVKGISDII